MDGLSANPNRHLFEAVVKPHRSLSRRGLLTLIGCMMAGSLFVTSLMFLLGAWPVIGFNGADIALAVFLLWLNVRAARARELVVLTDTSLNITRTDIHGRKSSLSLQPYWLNVVLEERAGTVPKLLLTTRGHAHEIARQLGETPKRDLAAALTRAMHQWRNPVYDNPQLREDEQ
jgi:uncharacterized membrane protein